MKNMGMIDKSKIDPTFKKQLGDVIDTYINLKDALFKSDYALAKVQSEKVKNALNNVDMLLLLGDTHNEWMKDLKILSEITTRYGNRNVNELEFSSPEDFKKYKGFPRHRIKRW